MTDLPPGWALASLGNLIAADGIFSDGDWIESKDQDPQGAVRLVQLADIGEGFFRDRSDRWLTRDKAQELNCTFLQQGDVLVARMPDPLGRACIYPGSSSPAVTAVDVCIIRPGVSGVDVRWLMWIINSPQVREQMRRYETGTTRKRISRKNLAKIQLCVPPLAEQRRIVAALEDHLSRIEHGSGQLVRLIRRIDRFRDALMATACTGKLVAGSDTGTIADKPSPANSVDGDLPEIPGHWRWARLGEVAEVVGGVTKDSKKQSDPTLPEVPYLRVANVQRGRLDLSTVTYIRVPEQKAKQLELRPGDVLLNEGGDRDKLGRGWIWENQIPGCIHQNHVFRARIQDGALHPKLLAWHANGFGKHWCEVNGKQSVNLASISLSKIKLLPVPLPPPEEQERLVTEAEQYLTLLDNTEQMARAALSRTHKLRRSLLAEAFAGRLVEQDPADEPASVLLERIQAERATQGPARRTRRGRNGTAPQKETLV